METATAQDPLYDSETLFLANHGGLIHESVGRVFDRSGWPLAPLEAPGRRLKIGIVNGQIVLRHPEQFVRRWPQTLLGWSGLAEFILAEGLHSRLDDATGTPSPGWGTPLDVASQFMPLAWQRRVEAELERRGVRYRGEVVRLRAPLRTNNRVKGRRHRGR